MLARQQLPAMYEEWNERWGAPYGRDLGDTTIRQRLASPDAAKYGPFGFQISNQTRRFEYPWAFFNIAPEPGRRVLDVGGGLSGLQFVLAQSGCHVTNVDPEAKHDDRVWSRHQTFGVPLSTDLHQRMVDVFEAPVTLIPERVQDADLAAGSFDRVVCLSVIEHVSPDESLAMMKSIADLLAPGGTCLLTIDLFLDVKPFGVLARNTWGTNIDVHRLVSSVDLELTDGDPAELFGFEQFDFDRTVSLIPQLLVGTFSALTQALILTKRS
jgi:2-polyprenyl-3-methyl-5-hydroxy-6-metoxy-1,4-benzoquinol methylase